MVLVKHWLAQLKYR